MADDPLGRCDRNGDGIERFDAEMLRIEATRRNAACGAARKLQNYHASAAFVQ
jgi:hypothetical protein